MNAPLRAPSPAQLDPIRALHVEAFDALIDRRLADSADLIGGRAALRLLKQLECDQLATLSSDPATGAVRATIFGITSPPTKFGAYGILRKWQTAARARLAQSS